MVLRLIALASVVAGTTLHAQQPAKVPAASAPTKAPATAPTKSPPRKAPLPALTKAPVPATGYSIHVGWLGFRTDPTDNSLIVEVAENSPAERAGLRAGDRIIASDDFEETVRVVPSKVPYRGKSTTPDSTQLALSRTYARGPVVGRSYDFTIRRGEETFSVELVAVEDPRATTLKLVPTRKSDQDTLEAEARAYRTELVRKSVVEGIGLPSVRDSTQMRRDSVVRGRSVSPAAAAPKTAVTPAGKSRYIVEEFGRQNRQGENLPQPAIMTDTAGNMWIRWESPEVRRAPLFISNAVAGAEFEQLNPALGQYFNGVTEGVFVLRVGPNSPAATAGLQPGDIVQSVNRIDVLTITQLREAIVTESGPITLGIMRLGKPTSVVLRKE